MCIADRANVFRSDYKVITCVLCNVIFIYVIYIVYIPHITVSTNDNMLYNVTYICHFTFNILALFIGDWRVISFLFSNWCIIIHPIHIY